MAIEVLVKKYQLGKEPTNALAWKDFSFTQRIEALESIRQEYHKSRYGDEPRLQRILRIAQQTPG